MAVGVSEDERYEVVLKIVESFRQMPTSLLVPVKELIRVARATEAAIFSKAANKIRYVQLLQACCDAISNSVRSRSQNQSPTVTQQSEVQIIPNPNQTVAQQSIVSQQSGCHTMAGLQNHVGINMQQPSQPSFHGHPPIPINRQNQFAQPRGFPTTPALF
ncbi:hypothetical protein HDU79_004275 [Rhizoclosmatium sp. JEL0117]|nr:hypothetical protein HDU79_004275 [Rhizoclosmatium sp. JEL0117]